MDSTVDLHIRKKMSKVKIYPTIEIMNRKAGLTAMLRLDSSAIEEVETLVVADRSLNPPLATSSLTHSNLSAFFEELYKSSKDSVKKITPIPSKITQKMNKTMK